MPNLFQSAKMVPIERVWNQNQSTVDSLYLEQPLSRTSLYLQLKSQSLCVTYFSLSISSSLYISNKFSGHLRVRDRECQQYSKSTNSPNFNQGPEQLHVFNIFVRLWRSLEKKEKKNLFMNSLRLLDTYNALPMAIIFLYGYHHQIRLIGHNDAQKNFVFHYEN